ncbi:MAG: hypothetical protein QOE46_1216 [Acidobacteriota bacterium]|nr:hypothetical protein [Acidobacteriota bacterium]
MRFGTRRRSSGRNGTDTRVSEQSQHSALPDAFPPAHELAVWLRALQSFFNAANHPLSEAERAGLGERSFKCETGVVRDALVRCLHLLGSFTRGESPPDTALDDEATSTAKVSRAVPDGALGLIGAKDSLADLADVFKDVCRLSEALLESPSVGFAAWSSLGGVLERELRRSEAAGLILAAGHGAGAAGLQEPLITLAHGLAPDDLGEDLLEIFYAFARLLTLLRFVELSLKSDAQLKRLLPVFTLVNEETLALLDFIEGRALRVEGVGGAASEILDGTAYAVRMELRKSFEHELTGLCSLRQPPQLFAKVENTTGLLRDCYQQSVVALAQCFDPTLDATGLFQSFKTRLEQSLELRRELWRLIILMRRASNDGESPPATHVLEGLISFGEGAQRYLMYKDWDALERFAEEIDSARGADELSRTLHRFEAFLETLFGQVNMRVVLAQHPFDLNSLES